MTPRVALLGGDDRLAAALPAHGFDAVAIGAAAPPLLAAALRTRKIGDGLERAPAALAALLRGRFAAVHAFGLLEAPAALAWTRATGRPFAVTFCGPLRRETIAGRRLRLATLERVLADAAVLRSASDEIAASVRTWVAVDAPVLASGDPAGHAALYDELLSAAPARARPGAARRRRP